MSRITAAFWLSSGWPEILWEKVPSVIMYYFPQSFAGNSPKGHVQSDYFKKAAGMGWISPHPQPPLPSISLAYLQCLFWWFPAMDSSSGHFPQNNQNQRMGSIQHFADNWPAGSGRSHCHSMRDCCQHNRMVLEDCSWRDEEWLIRIAHNPGNDSAAAFRCSWSKGQPRPLGSYYACPDGPARWGRCHGKPWRWHLLPPLPGC